MGGRTERVGGITGGVKVLGSACRRFRLEMFVPGGCGLGQGGMGGASCQRANAGGIGEQDESDVIVDL